MLSDVMPWLPQAGTWSFRGGAGGRPSPSISQLLRAAGYVYNLAGGAQTKMQCPHDERKQGSESHSLPGLPQLVHPLVLSGITL